MNELNEKVAEPKMKGQGAKTSRTGKIRTVATAIVVGFIAFSVIWPAIDKKVRLDRNLTCGRNLFEMGRAISMYREEFVEYPTPDKWCDLLLERAGADEALFKCPGNKRARCSFSLNPNAEPNGPGDLVVLFESKGGWNQFGGPELLTVENHKPRGCNVLFNDGHVEFVRADEVDRLIWTAEPAESAEENRN
jgi:prepilin-type processing-associated H-X9-DG protein